MAIIAQYNYVWKKANQVDVNHLLAEISEPTLCEIYGSLNAEVVQSIPIWKEMKSSIQRRIARYLKPQIVLPDGKIYDAGDVGHSIMFVYSGKIRVTLSTDRSRMDSFGVKSLNILLNKYIKLGEYYEAGDHFGEFCLLSKSGQRPDSASAMIKSELYSLHKENLWNVLTYCTIEDRQLIILELLSRTNSTYHIQFHPYYQEDANESNDSVNPFYEHRSLRTVRMLLAKSKLSYGGHHIKRLHHMVYSTMKELDEVIAKDHRTMGSGDTSSPMKDDLLQDDSELSGDQGEEGEEEQSLSEEEWTESMVTDEKVNTTLSKMELKRFGNKKEDNLKKDRKDHPDVHVLRELIRKEMNQSSMTYIDRMQLAGFEVDESEKSRWSAIKSSPVTSSRKAMRIEVSSPRAVLGSPMGSPKGGGGGGGGLLAASVSGKSMSRSSYLIQRIDRLNTIRRFSVDYNEPNEKSEEDDEEEDEVDEIEVDREEDDVDDEDEDDEEGEEEEAG